MSDINDYFIGSALRSALAETIGNLVIDLEIEVTRRHQLQMTLDLVTEAMKRERGLSDDHVSE